MTRPSDIHFSKFSASCVAGVLQKLQCAVEIPSTEHESKRVYSSAFFHGIMVPGVKYFNVPFAVQHSSKLSPAHF